MSATNRPVVLLSDFGDAMGYAGQMRGVLLKGNPQVRMVDLCHSAPARDVRAAAFLLRSALEHFPPEAVFLCVVDPGVGTERRPLALKAAGRFFVGPDNGLFGFLQAEKRLEAAHVIEIPEETAFPSDTFHGRDVFAPAAARISLGRKLASLGPPAGRILEPDPARFSESGDEIRGEILLFDGFGNALTSISNEAATRFAFLHDSGSFRVRCGKNGMAFRRTFADVAPGRPLAYPGSSGTLEIGVNFGSARDVLGLEEGMDVILSIA